MFKPYQHGTESVQIDDLTIENQIDCISVYGNLQITKDQLGLKNAKALQDLIDAVVAVLEQENLPIQTERQANQEIDNPFFE